MTIEPLVSASLNRRPAARPAESACGQPLRPSTAICCRGSGARRPFPNRVRPETDGPPNPPGVLPLCRSDRAGFDVRKFIAPRRALEVCSSSSFHSWISRAMILPLFCIKDPICMVLPPAPRDVSLTRSPGFTPKKRSYPLGRAVLHFKEPRMEGLGAEDVFAFQARSRVSGNLQLC